MKLLQPPRLERERDGMRQRASETVNHECSFEQQGEILLLRRHALWKHASLIEISQSFSQGFHLQACWLVTDHTCWRMLELHQNKGRASCVSSFSLRINSHTA